MAILPVSLVNSVDKGKKIDFRAVDMYRVRDGFITDNWHLEDYQTLFSQLAAKAVTTGAKS